MNEETLFKILMGNQSKRDKQTNIGPSEIGGCSRKVWHRIQGTPVTNTETLRLAAWMGTAIHAGIEKEFDKTDPFQIRYIRELEVSFNGTTGHVDCYDVVEKRVIDWKTTTKKNRAKFPTAQQRMQVQVYGYLLSNTGHDVEIVSLVAICRDGNENDVVIHTEPYDEKVALQGFAWVQSIRDMSEPPPPEMPARVFCSNYCQFYDRLGAVGCPGK